MIPATGLAILDSRNTRGAATGAGMKPNFGPCQPLPATARSRTPGLPASDTTLPRRDAQGARAFAQDPAGSMVRVALRDELSRKRRAVAGRRVPNAKSAIEDARRSGRRLDASGSPQLSFVRWLAEPAEMRAATPGGNLARPTPLPAATVRQRKERNRTAIRLLSAWLHEDAEVESDTWDLLKSELDRDRLSGRRLWT